jgi:hypothetical protein
VGSVALGESRSVGFAGEGRGEGRREAAMLTAVIASWRYGGLDRGNFQCAPRASRPGVGRPVPVVPSLLDSKAVRGEKRGTGRGPSHACSGS